MLTNVQHPQTSHFVHICFFPVRTFNLFPLSLLKLVSLSCSPLGKSKLCAQVQLTAGRHLWGGLRHVRSPCSSHFLPVEGSNTYKTAASQSNSFALPMEGEKVKEIYLPCFVLACFQPLKHLAVPKTIQLTTLIKKKSVCCIRQKCSQLFWRSSKHLRENMNGEKTGGETCFSHTWTESILFCRTFWK